MLPLDVRRAHHIAYWRVWTIGAVRRLAWIPAKGRKARHGIIIIIFIIFDLICFDLI